MYEDKRSLYQQLEDLKEGKRVLQSAIHGNFYNRAISSVLYDKIKWVNKEIARVRQEIKKEEEKKNEKFRKNI